MSRYAPPGESASDLWLEKSNFVGAVLGGVFYGVHATVFAACVYRISQAPAHKDRRLRHWGPLVYITLLFAMGTVNLACNTKMNQLMFIDNRAYPGGPTAWFVAFYSDGVNTAGNAAYVIANFLADGLLLWRTYVVWNRLWVVVFPFIVFLASTAMSFMTLFQASRPNASLWNTTTVMFSLPYFTISISLNIILTLLLVSRLLYMSHNATKAIGREHATTYISIAAMLVESAAPYAIAGLVFIITYARNSNVQNLVLPVLSQIMCISPEFIILRVATGRAVSSRPSASLTSGVAAATTTMKFRSRKQTDGSFALASLATEGGTNRTGSLTLGSKPDLINSAEARV